MVGPRICRSPRHNPPLGSEDELARGLPRALIEGSNTPTLSPLVSQALTPALAPALASALSFTNEFFKQFIKAYLESN